MDMRKRLIFKGDSRPTSSNQNLPNSSLVIPAPLKTHGGNAVVLRNRHGGQTKAENECNSRARIAAAARKRWKTAKAAGKTSLVGVKVGISSPFTPMVDPHLWLRQSRICHHNSARRATQTSRTPC